MKQKIKRLIAVIIALTIIMSQASLFSYAYEEDLVQAITVTAQKQLIEDCDGYWEPFEYEGESYQYFRYDPYNAAPYFDVTFSDGYTFSGSWDELYEYFSMKYGMSVYQSYENDQSYFTPWRAGMHSTTLMLFVSQDDSDYKLAECELEVEVIETPVVELVLEPLIIIENTNGFLTEYYNPETGEYEPAFYYYINDFDFSVSFADGTKESYECGSGFDYNGSWYSFEVAHGQEYAPLTKGTYEFPVTVFGYETTAKVEIIETPVADVVVKPQQFVYEIDGYWQEGYEEESFFRYNLDNVEYTVIMKDGSEFHCQPGEGFDYNGRYQQLTTDYNQDENHLTVGEYEIPMSIMGFETIVPVEIVECPIDGIHIMRTSIPENTGGSYESYYNEETGEIVDYYHYDIMYNAVVYFKDGTQYSCENSDHVEWMGRTYYFTSSYSQEQNPLTMGEYELPVSLMGYDTSVTVEITALPIESIVFNFEPVVEYTNGYWTTCENEETGESEEYFRYYINDYSGTVTMHDGSQYSLNQDCMEFFHNGRTYYVELNENQAENHFTVGVNEIPVSVGSYQTTVGFEVLESPVESLVVEPMKIIENSNGYRNEKYDAESDSYISYYHYDLGSFNYVATLKDGTVISSDEWGNSFEYDGRWYSLDVENTQYESPFELGMNTVRVSFAGCVATAQIEIVECPIESIVFDTKTIAQFTNGYNDGYYDSEQDTYIEFYFYHLDNFSFTVTFKDGSSEEYSNWSGIVYDNVYYDIINNYSQYDNPLGLGTHEIPVSIMGFDAIVSVEIVDTPIVDITVEPKTVIQNTGGYWNKVYNDETGEETRYYHYNLSNFNYTVKLIDGREISCYGGEDFSYGDGCYSLSPVYDQSENPLTVGTHEITVSVLNFETTATIEIVESPVVSLVVEPKCIIENTNGWWSTRNDGESDALEDYYHYSLNEFNAAVTLRDGAEYIGSGLEYDGQYYSLEIDYNQDDAPLGIGTHEIPVSILGFEAIATLEIVECPVMNVEFEPKLIAQHAGGYWGQKYDYETDEFVEYYYYNIGNFNFVINFNDGTQYSGENSSGAQYGDTWYSFTINYDQYENPLGLGTHEIPVSIMGYDTTVTVEIADRLVESVTLEPVIHYQGISGEESERYNEETGEWDSYYRYPLESFSYAIELTNGTVLEGTGNGVYFNGEWYSFDVFLDQYETPLTLGKHDVTVSVLGYETILTVEILATPVERIDFEPVTLVHGIDGGWNGYHDEETGEYIEYYHYNLDSIDYTVTMADGSVIDCATGSDFYYNNNWYMLNIDYNQAKNPLMPGTHKIPVSLLGYETTLPVEILSTPVVSMDFEPATLVYSIDGGWNGYHDEETGEYVSYYHYNLASIRYTATMLDGSVVNYTGWDEFDYKGNWCMLSIDYDQAKNPLTPGIHEIPVSLLGYETTVTVEIIGSPVESIEIEPVSLEENEDGWWSTRCDEETGDCENYYHYNLESIEYTVTMLDGSVFETSIMDGFWFADNWHTLTIDYDQTKNPLMPGTHEIPVSVLGYEATVTVEIKEPYNVIESITAYARRPLREIVDACWSGSKDGYYFRYDFEDADPWYTVTLKTGEVIEGTIDDLSCYFSEAYGYDFRIGGYSTNDTQSFYNTWGPGVHSITVYFMRDNEIGMGSCELEIEVIESPVAQVTIEPCTIVENTNGCWTIREIWGVGEEEYFRYSLNRFNFNVTMKDGTKIQCYDASGFDYNGEWYSVENYSQSCESLVLGNNQVPVYVAGYLTTADVEIIASPIEGITFEPKAIVENTKGYWAEKYDMETDTTERFYYYYIGNLSYTVTLNDGTEIFCENGNEFYHNGNLYSLSLSYDQYENPFTLGSNEISYSVAGYKGTTTIEIIESPVESVVVAPKTFVQNTCGYFDGYYNAEGEWVEYYNYELGYFPFTVTFKDGTETESDGSFWYRGSEYTVNVLTVQEENPLTLGTNEISVSFMGYKTTAIVEIIDTPVESVSIQPVTLIENADGYWNDSYNEQTDSYDRYYHYNFDFDYVITMRDGTEIIPDDMGDFFYNDGWHRLNVNYDQYLNPLTAGTHEIPVSILNYETTATVIIEESPIVSIEADPLRLVYETDGYWATAWDDMMGEYSYFRYYISSAVFTVTFRDGSTIDWMSGEGFEYNGRWYNFGMDYDQRSNPMTIGTYEIPVSFIGFNSTLTVEIIDTPVESVSIWPVTLIENADGYWDYRHNEQTDSYDRYYDYYLDFDYVLTMSDGTEIVPDDMGYFFYNGDWHRLNVNYDQYLNPLTVGTHEIPVSVLGYETTAAVEIVESPVASIDVKPMSLIYEKDGWWDTAWDDMMNEYQIFCYDIYSAVFTVTFKDGSSVDWMYGESFEYNGRWYDFEMDYDRYRNPMTIGTYEIPVSFIGFNSTATVEIIDTPIASVEMSPVELVVNSAGYWDVRYNPETEEDESFFYYYISNYDYVVTMKDGQVIRCYEGDGFSYNGRWYAPELITYQYEKPLMPGTNEVKMDVLGYEATLIVEILSSPIRSLVFEKKTLIQNSNGYWDTRYNAGTQEYEDYYYYHINNLNYTVTFADGNECYYAGDNGLYYNNRWYDLQVNYNQYNKPLGIGVHEIPVNILGYEAILTFEIIDTPVESVVVKPHTVVFETEGSWDYVCNDDIGACYSYFRYDLSSFDLEVTFKDGSTYVAEDGNSIPYNGTWYSYTVEYKQYANPLTLGTHQIPISIMNFDAVAEVEIILTPIESIVIEPVTFIEYTHGRWTERYDDYTGELCEYYDYMLNELDYTVYFIDGTKASATDSNEIYYGNNRYFFNEVVPQMLKPLEPGITEFGLSILNFETTVIINIVPSPVVDVAVEPIELIEGCNGFWDIRYVEATDSYEPYYCYYLDDVGVTLTLYDGTTVECATNYAPFEYMGEKYYPTFDYSQYENPFVSGTNEFDVTILGCDATVTVEVIESPVMDVTIKPQTIIEDTNGYKEIYYDDFGNESYLFWYSLNPVCYTVTLKDGSVFECASGNPVIYKGKTYYMDTDYDQREKPLKVGINEIPVSILGYDATFNIEIIESPIQNITVEPVVIKEYTNGGWRWMSYGTGNIPVFIYDISYTDVDLTITMKDGTVVRSLNGWVTYKGTDYHVGVYWDSQYENPFVVGSNEMRVDVMGQTVTSEVIITPDDNGNFLYDEIADGVVITGYKDTSVRSVVIPEEINGKPVVGIANLALPLISELTVPDSVKFLSAEWLLECCSLEKLTLGKSATGITVDMFTNALAIKEIEISDENPEYTVINNAIYTKDGTTLIYYPIANGSRFVVPAGVKNIDILFSHYIYSPLWMATELEVVFDEATEFVTIDGVTYTADMTTIVCSDKSKTGTYVMPDTVTTMYNNAFAGSMIEAVEISDNVNEIVYAAFASCLSLKSVKLPENVKVIGEHSFTNCVSLTEIEIPDSVEVVDSWSFRDCDSLKRIALGENTYLVGIAAFENCTALKSVDLVNVTEIASNAFYRNTALTSIELPSSLYSVGSFAFSESGLTAITIPESVMYLEHGAFAYCRDLADVTLLAAPEYLGYTFAHTPIESIVVPEGVTSVNEAFVGCENLKDVTLPSTIDYISKYDFEDTAILADKSAYTDGMLYIGDILLDSKAGITEAAIKPGTRVIAAYAFQSQIKLRTVDIPEGVEIINTSAFGNCIKLSVVNLPSTLRTICEYAFKECCSLSEIDLPEGLESIGAGILYGTAITSIKIPSTITNLVYRGFGATYLKDIELADAVVVLEGAEFYGTPWYENQPEGMIYLGNVLYEYNGVYEDNELVIDDGVTGIAGFAFTGQRISSLTVPSSVRAIGDKAFEFTGLEELKLSEGLEYIGARAFAGNKLKTVSIPASVSYIDITAFEDGILEAVNVDENNEWYTSIDGVLYNKDCTELLYCPEAKTGTVTIPASVCYVHMYAFSDSSVSKIIVENDDISIDYMGFGRGCSDAVWSIEYINVIEIECRYGSAAYLYAIENGQPFSIMADPEEPPVDPEEPSTDPEEPSTDPEEPSSKPEEPSSKPEEPSSKPEEPSSKPEEPSSKPEEPSSKPEEPSSKPEEPSSKPEEPSSKPEEPSSKPEEPSTDPEEPSSKPEEPSSKPEEPSSKPEEPSSKPEEPTTKPEEPSSKPEEPSSKPEEPSSKPEEPSSKPEEPSSKPEEPSSKPEEPSSKPEEPSSKPEEPSSKPEEPSSKPEEPSSKPEEPSSKPEEPSSKPEEPSSKPEEPSSKPEEPSSKPEKPSSKPEEPSSKPEKPSSKPAEPSTKEPEKELQVEANTNIKVDNATNTSTVVVGKSVEIITKSIKNANIEMVDKNGKELSKKDLVGTGSKIIIKDDSGKVVSEYVVIVPTDVDGNGKLTAADARLALRGSAKLDKVEGVYSVAADMNGDGKITAADARTILRRSAGLEK